MTPQLNCLFSTLKASLTPSISLALKSNRLIFKTVFQSSYSITSEQILVSYYLVPETKFRLQNEQRHTFLLSAEGQQPWEGGRSLNIVG